jgi:hypothetical protein
MNRSGSPLAYVFWHSPASAAAGPAYRSDLLAFHSSLAARPPPGLRRSETFAVAGASWLEAGAESYEDWYLVSNWSAVGDLNHEAVAAPHQASHDRIAHQAAGGAGAIYRLHAGSDSPGCQVGTWFAKPPGWSYGRLDDALVAVLDDGGSLWRRQLVLGPAPEFCLRRESPPARLPEGIAGEVLDYRPLA